MFKQPGCDVDLSVISVWSMILNTCATLNWVYSKKCNSQLLTAHFLSILKPCNSLQREDELDFLSLKLDRWLHTHCIKMLNQK